MDQRHLSYKEMTDLGCFYTPDGFVTALINMIKSNVADYGDYVYLDSSCGYGSFLKALSPYRTIGCDIDGKAIEFARGYSADSEYYTLNTLHNFSRASVKLKDEERLIIIGNPPYNDTTSRVKNGIKKTEPCFIDDDIKTRDLGISFLLSYVKLKPDYVAVLHPLSYMIKKANYLLLKPFYADYSLIDHVIISSQQFGMTSKTKGFPIIIALYERSAAGTTYTDIYNLNFRTVDNRLFNIRHDNIDNYITKYPSKNKICKDGDILFFTMRDINALNRSRTFIEDYSENAIIIDKNKFAYYCYVDVFKDYIPRLPYYYGNCNVFIDNAAFLPIANAFITKSIQKHPWLKNKIDYVPDYNFRVIDEYFNRLFGN